MKSVYSLLFCLFVCAAAFSSEARATTFFTVETENRSEARAAINADRLLQCRNLLIGERAKKLYHQLVAQPSLHSSKNLGIEFERLKLEAKELLRENKVLIEGGEVFFIDLGRTDIESSTALCRAEFEMVLYEGVLYAPSMVKVIVGGIGPRKNRAALLVDYSCCLQTP